MALKTEVAARTDIGLVRRSNQDSFGSDDALHLYVVCDGMGGAAGGEIASKLATENFLATARREAGMTGDSANLSRSGLTRAIHGANLAVRERADAEPRYRGMGSTLVGAYLEDAQLTIVNVGDSRAYLFRQGAGRQITEDHSYVAERVKMGFMTAEEAETSSMQSLITRAIGAEEDVMPDLYRETLVAGDLVLLTTDGLTRHLSLPELCTAINGAQFASADQLCRHLIELALLRGGSDNVTCLMLRVLSV